MDITITTTDEHKFNVSEAIVFYHYDTVRILIEEFRRSDKFKIGWTESINEDQWECLYEVIEGETAKYGIVYPKEKMEDLKAIVRPLFTEVEKWYRDHQYLELFDVDLYRVFLWFDDGTIDRELTAMILAESECLNISKRFELACNYFLKEHIPLLWHKLSEVEKKNFASGMIQTTRMVQWWTKKMMAGVKVEEMRLEIQDEDFDQLCFNAFYSNQTALERIWYLLEREDRELSIRKIAEEKNLIPDVMRLCLTHMNPEQKAKIFQKSPFKSLLCCLKWPYQNRFQFMATYLWPFLSRSDFIHLIYFIIYHKILDNWSDYDYVELLTIFFHQSPDCFKEYIKDEIIYQPLLCVIDGIKCDKYLNTQLLKVKLHDPQLKLPHPILMRYRKACNSC
ncbi:RNase H domain-containing protein [Caerostris extrusa]|uniref:RNase H domain-containing protein n=1 Tax=Caerostris extrusa TaxID=172846 RepID=A0AAV4Y7E3_CAEEX|nr:RNase H domain-containing protein [Caerostris extrusa]